jgi:hypothetical protein
MIKQRVLGLTKVAAAAMLGGGGIPHAAASECGIGGTWFGHDPGTGLRWLGMHTPGTSATTGQISIEWSFVDPGFRGQFPATELTAGKRYLGEGQAGQLHVDLVRLRADAGAAADARLDDGAGVRAEYERHGDNANL